MRKIGAFPVTREWQHPKEAGVTVCLSGNRRYYQSGHEAPLYGNVDTTVTRTFTTLREAVSYRDGEEDN